MSGTTFSYFLVVLSAIEKKTEQICFGRCKRTFVFTFWTHFFTVFIITMKQYFSNYITLYLINYLDGPEPPVLLQVDLIVNDQQSCKNLFPNLYDTEKQICIIPDPYKGTCNVMLYIFNNLI